MSNELTTIGDIDKAIASCKADHASSYMRLGAILLLVRDNPDLWKGQHESFAQFITSHGLSRSWSYACIGVVERFGERGLGILPSRLQLLLPIKTNDREDEDILLSQARDLPSEAFRNTLVERKGGKPTDTCEHNEVRSYCKTCGKHLT